MFSPFVVQMAVAALAVFSVGGVLISLLYPRLAGGSKTEKRLEAIADSKRKAAADRISAEEGRRRRSVEDTLKELEEAQKAKARSSTKPTLTVRMRQAGAAIRRLRFRPEKRHRPQLPPPPPPAPCRAAHQGRASPRRPAFLDQA